VIAAGRLPPELVGYAASVPFALAVAVIAVGVARSVLAWRTAPRQLAAALSLGLELFLAAALIRLAAIDDLADLGLVAAIIALRQLISRGVGFAVRALGADAPGRLRA
jgi:hypothetical protein